MATASPAVRPYGGVRVADLPPAVFSIVMATGIVATAAHLLGIGWLAWLLLGLNVVLYVALAGATVARIATVPERVRADFRSHGVAPG